MNALSIRPARAEDVTTVLSILNEASAWLQGRGIQQWPGSFDPSWLEPALGTGGVWLAEVDGNPVGTMSVTWQDPLWPADGTAGYVHRLAARRRMRGLGAWLLNRADALATARDRSTLRLDCVAHNTALRRYYEALGLEHRGDVELVRGPSPAPLVVSRYERRLRVANVSQRTAAP